MIDLEKFSRSRALKGAIMSASTAAASAAVSAPTTPAAAITRYAFAAQVNAARVAAGLEGVIPSQMIYNYAAKGYLKVNAKGLLDQAAANAWLAKYIARAKAKAAQA